MAEERETRRTVRCAIYTRKSTEEGLDQDFNSLDAQREAAEAYIKSQRQLGWTVLPHHYDDGGFTGGNIERPALKCLLKDIEAHHVDCVVVYKVDRLSRSLLDFARLMDLFDQRAVSFVSVTQQFNTITSLGRLTLNILLSFAQFEREIIGERTRDKMSAAHGAQRRGSMFTATNLLRLLTNPIYVGKVIHKEKTYPGEHEAIVEAGRWEDINADLRLARRGPNSVLRTNQVALLNGILYCGNCDRPMVPTYTSKGARRYRYYVCHVAREKGCAACPTKAIAARVIEDSVITQLRSALRSPDARDQLQVSDADRMAFDEGNPFDLIRTIVQRIKYDRTSGKVALELGRK
jgi:site-specific DNA recombinase